MDNPVIRACVTVAPNSIPTYVAEIEECYLGGTSRKSDPPRLSDKIVADCKDQGGPVLWNIGISLRKKSHEMTTYLFFFFKTKVKRTTCRARFTGIFDLGERDLTQGCFATWDERSAPVGSASASLSISQNSLSLAALSPTLRRQRQPHKSVVFVALRCILKKKIDN